MSWESIIGLEVHVQLNTKSKIFSHQSTQFGADPNTQICGIDIGLPGALPVPNQEAINKALKFGLSIHAQIPTVSIFARKNYFYPDLPKGYQISQFNDPIVGKGYLDIVLDDNTSKRVGITRAHLEEDAGKSIHGELPGYTGIDLNRAGIPLLEIVSEPELHSPKEALLYLKALHSLVCHLDICEGNLQEGQFRCDANVSIRKKGAEKLGTRVEIKNLNSFRFVERALEFEIERQINCLENNETIIQETRLFDSNKNQTRAMRSKEESHDYRYFADPDLLPLHIEPQWLETLHKTLPELPEEKRQRYITNFGINPQEALLISNNKHLSVYFESTLNHLPNQAKLIVNWMLTELLGALNKAELDINQCPISPKAFAELLNRIVDGTISGKIAKQVFDAIFKGEGHADEIIKREGLQQVTDTSLIETIVEKVIASNPDQVEEYLQGKDKVFGFLVGQVMKASKGKASPNQVNVILREKLKRP